MRKLSCVGLLICCSQILAFAAYIPEETTYQTKLYHLLSRRMLALCWRIEHPLYLLSAQEHVPLPPDEAFEQPLGSKPVRVIRPYDENETLGSASAQKPM